MPPLQEAIVKNWKSTAQPILTSLLVIFGALGAQEVSLGHVGKGSVVSLIVMILKGLIGVIQKD